jgi:hypothetical protein
MSASLVQSTGSPAEVQAVSRHGMTLYRLREPG